MPNTMTEDYQTTVFDNLNHTPCIKTPLQLIEDVFFVASEINRSLALKHYT